MRQELQTRMEMFVSDLERQYVTFDAVVTVVEDTMDTTMQHTADLTYMVELEDMTIMVMLNEALAGGSVVVACNTDGLPGMGAARIATMTITSIGATQENIGNISSITAHDKITALFANIFRYVNLNILGAQEGDQNVEESDEVDTP